MSFATNDPAPTLHLRRLGRRQPRRPAVRVVDDGDAGFATVGPWTAFAGQGSAPTSTTPPPAPGRDTASWTFTGLTPGLYRVSATWTPFTNRATNAPFTVLDGAHGAGDGGGQPAADAGRLHRPGGAWQDLGGPYTITGTTLTVRLSDPPRLRHRRRRPDRADRLILGRDDGRAVA